MWGVVTEEWKTMVENEEHGEKGGGVKMNVGQRKQSWRNEKGRRVRT